MKIDLDIIGNALLEASKDRFSIYLNDNNKYELKDLDENSCEFNYSNIADILEVNDVKKFMPKQHEAMYDELFEILRPNTSIFDLQTDISNLIVKHNLQNGEYGFIYRGGTVMVIDLSQINVNDYLQNAKEDL